jgi:glutathione S-transferase
LLPAGRGTARDSLRWRLSIACDIHPLNNLRVLQYLRASWARATRRSRAGTASGCRADSRRSRPGSGVIRATVATCHGTQVTLADVCLLPQVFNSRRYQLDLAP